MKFNPPFPSITQLRDEYIQSELTFHRGQQFLEQGRCSLMSQGDDRFEFLVEDRFEDFLVTINLANAELFQECNCASPRPCCHHAVCALLYLSGYFQKEASPEIKADGMAYSREEMIQRVLKEREERAANETFSLDLADNIHGIHRIKTAAGRIYELTIRDFKKHTGYCSCPDFKTNKLGTCKHLIYTLRIIHKKLPVERLTDLQPFPFVEIYCDPLNNYEITYFYKGKLTVDIASLLEKFFHKQKYVDPADYPAFVGFLQQAGDIKKILVRPEVHQRIEHHFDGELLQRLAQSSKPNFSKLKLKLFDYQKAGVLFSLFKKGTVIADEMGLGKTAQAIATAVLKKDIFDLKKTLIICPASLKSQWQQEIERFSSESAEIVEGGKEQRSRIYRESQAYFLISNYESVLRDVSVIQQNPPDMIILDEAQRIKNYNTLTSFAVKAIPKKHALVLTGTPIENRLGDLYSIMNFIDPKILAPLWEFSMQHCYFDPANKDRITGYFNLQKLKERLNPWLIRRQKADVLKELPDVNEINVPVNLHPEQEAIHATRARSLSAILAKKHKTVYDIQNMHQLLQSMRMVCDSTFLVDKETHISPKMDELEEILLDNLNILENDKKIIIFSEWVVMLQLIGKMLKANNIGSVMLSGKVPVKKRDALIREFRENPECKVFLSSEAGGSGLNLQMADTVINFELPWNPAKKNQRIGRVHRIGQESDKITVINLVTRQSIEQRIQDGIELKTSLFDAVLNEGNMTDEVDFSRKGRSTFIQQISELVKPFEDDGIEVEEQFESAAPRRPLVEGTQLPLFGDVDNLNPAVSRRRQPSAVVDEAVPKAADIDAGALEEALTKGLDFLNGLVKITTGKELQSASEAISVDKETGEVVLKFKLPGFGE